MNGRAVIRWIGAVLLGAGVGWVAHDSGYGPTRTLCYAAAGAAFVWFVVIPSPPGAE